MISSRMSNGMSYATMDLQPAARQFQAGYESDMLTKAAPDFICIPGSVIHNRVFVISALADSAGLLFLNPHPYPLPLKGEETRG
jgi:hypothetical protein